MSTLDLVTEELNNTKDELNQKIGEFGGCSQKLYYSLENILNCFNKISNKNRELEVEVQEIDKVFTDYKIQIKNIQESFEAETGGIVSLGALGGATGAALAVSGPSIVMGLATTFGVTSAGTAISSLSGVAATNAALAWLGGGALAAGGGGVAAGSAVLSLMGPVGWGIAGVAALVSVFFIVGSVNKKKRLEDIYSSIFRRDINQYKLAIVEINERMKRALDESKKLDEAVTLISEFGTDYTTMTEQQKYTLGSYVNLMKSSERLLINPIEALKAKYTEEDFEEYKKQDLQKGIFDFTNDFIKMTMEANGRTDYEKYLVDSDKKAFQDKNLCIYLANLFYKVEIDYDDRKILYKSFRDNKKFIKGFDIKLKDFDDVFFDKIFRMLDIKYQNEKKLKII